MLSNRFFPYSSMQEINLDWILTKIKNILRFVPDDGAVGQILRRTAHGAEWSDEQGGGGGAVSSVNGQTGAVVLTASDVGALPDTYVAPVDSVNGQTGAVVLDAGDVGALPDTTVIPSDTSDLTNTAGFVNAAGAAAAAPVQSVNGQTGAVVIPTGTPLDAYPVGSIYMSVNSTSPSTLFGGTWERLKDRFLLASGDNYTAGDTGGEAAHTLTESELPAISGSFKSRPWASGSMFYDPQGAFTTETAENILGCTNSGVQSSSRKVNINFGGGQAHNNMPPYLAVYMWKRTA